MTPLRQRMIEELQLRNLSEATIQTYVSAVFRFARYFGKSPGKLGPEHVRQYLLHLRNDNKDTWSTLQVNRGALKFLYVRVLKQGWFDEEIAAPKKRPQAITVLSAEQITVATVARTARAFRIRVMITSRCKRLASTTTSTPKTWLGSGFSPIPDSRLLTPIRLIRCSTPCLRSPFTLSRQATPMYSPGT